jgi:hypothetical protein
VKLPVHLALISACPTTVHSEYYNHDLMNVKNVVVITVWSRRLKVGLANGVRVALTLR